MIGPCRIIWYCLGGGGLSDERGKIKDAYIGGWRGLNLRRVS